MRERGRVRRREDEGEREGEGAREGRGSVALEYVCVLPP